MKQHMPPVLNIIALATFAASLSARALDPVLPHVAGDFGVSIAAAASFAAVFAFTFAIVQPVLGAAADLFGKARLMIICLVLLGLASILGALSTSFPMLFASRILAGIGSGGVFPIALGLTSDLVGPDRRQVAIGRTLAGAMTGNLLGASASGIIGDFLGWRGVLAVLGVLVIAASVAVAIGFRGAALKPTPQTNFTALKLGYRTIFANPNARVCYSAVFIEGCCVLGLFPFIAAFLFELGETSLSIAGVVIAGFAVGGLFYTMSVSRFLPRLGVNGMMISGAALVGLQLAIIAFGPGWKIQALSLLFMGWGFYMIHGCLQVFASELSVEARATALSLHSFFFFMGQTIGPIAYGFGIGHLGKTPTLLLGATIMIALGFACARLLRQTRPAGCRRTARRPALTAAAIGCYALIRNPHALRQFAGLPEHVDGNAAARKPVGADAQPFRFDLGGQAFADRHRAVLVKRAVIAEACDIKLQRLRFQQPFPRHIVDHEMGEIRLSGNRADRGKFRHRKAHQIVGAGLRIGHAIDLRFLGRFRPWHRAAELQLRRFQRFTGLPGHRDLRCRFLSQLDR
jgi:predicted MFS family arabinose efflux permease